MHAASRILVSCHANYSQFLFVETSGSVLVIMLIQCLSCNSCIRERRKQKFVEMEQALDALAAQTKDMNTLQNQHHMLQVHWLQMVWKVPACARGAHCISYVYTHCLRLACINRLGSVGKPHSSSVTYVSLYACHLGQVTQAPATEA